MLPKDPGDHPRRPPSRRSPDGLDLLLVEPLHHEDLVDRPNLGCAMLMGACREAGLRAGLLEGQTRVVHDLAEGGTAEYWALLHDLTAAEADELQLCHFIEGCDQLEQSGFEERFRRLYHDIVIAKDPRALLDGRLAQDLARLVRVYIQTCRARLRGAPREPLAIVDRTVSEILRRAPRIVGFSLQGEWDEIGGAIRARLRERSRAPVVAGGPLTAFMEAPGRSLAERGIDWLVLGEGETVLPELVRRLTAGGDPEDMAGVVGAQAPPDRVEPALADVDALPTPDFTDYDLSRFLSPAPVLPLQSARGCTWRRCAFCAHHTMYAGRYRPLAIAAVVATMRRLSDLHGVRHFAVHDEEVPPARARRLAAAIVDASLDVRLNLYGRLVEGFDGETVDAMWRAGCRSVEWGLESGSDRVLRSMRKGTAKATMARVLHDFAARGVANQCFVVIGFPGERREEADETVGFLRAHASAIHNLLLNVFRLDPASPIGRDPSAWGLERSGDGTWTNREGMAADEARDYLSRLQSMIALDATSFLAGLQSAAWGNDGRMLRFIAQCLGPLPDAGGADGASGSTPSDALALYPVVPGALRQDGGHAVLQPIALHESPFVNRIRPPTPMGLDAVTSRAVTLADGTLTLALLAERAGEGDPADAARALEFVCALLRRGQALAFSEPWPAPLPRPAAPETTSRP